MLLYLIFHFCNRQHLTACGGSGFEVRTDIKFSALDIIFPNVFLKSLQFSSFNQLYNKLKI